jgi:hypothetical protein
MAKLKNIIKQLSEKDFRELYDSMQNGNAEKSAYLLKALRDKNLSDAKIMVGLGVNENAFYTLRSRLHQRIEEFLYEELEGARTETLRKVANVNETLFNKKKTISIATLKKLEKELLDYDMSSELTIIYKSLKRLNINTPEYYQYSQLYNRHVAYMLAVDKAEDMLADYFKKYGLYFLSGIESMRIELDLLVREMKNVAKLYQSHRLYVYQSCMLIWHMLFVEREESIDSDSESIEDTLQNIQKIFDTYQLDSIYYHLNLVFEFLRFEYYNHYKVWKQSEKIYDEVNEGVVNLLMNYGNYTFPSQLIISKIKRHIRLGTESNMLDEIDAMFYDYEVDESDVPKHLILTLHNALALYYKKDFEQSARIVNGILNDVMLRRFPYTMLEIKCFLALLYVILEENELFKQLTNSIHRQARIIGEEVCENITHFNKLLRIAISETKRNKAKKINSIIKEIRWDDTKFFSPVSMVKLDKNFVKLLCKR